MVEIHDQPDGAEIAPVATQPNPSPGKKLLKSWLNKHMKILLSDGRTLLGTFLCTDKDQNVILGSCTETMPEEDEEEKKELDMPQKDGRMANKDQKKRSEPRNLGLAMIPGKHIVSIHIDEYPIKEIS